MADDGYEPSSLLSLIRGTATLPAQDRLSGRNFATRSEVLARNGMAATNHPLATQIASDVLKDGGTAVDAAIAFLGFADPAMNGIGGDLFAIVWNAEEDQLYGLNGSGRSPGSLTIDYFTSRNMRSIPAAGPLPVTAPYYARSRRQLVGDKDEGPLRPWPGRQQPHHLPHRCGPGWQHGLPDRS